ncbi:hypothetical protein [Aureibacter tunicatorum]|uniref:Uncharacterized protein n=1 Tax=Aureibacter tunicatorum TaxID=866807 RepID=A0AAE3XSF9_9BACT|nr:hypothetical protein [Aureibacter tunicatorum]MDR6241184.1 hypothetical protein [Aureibacter tunicatorum]BDD03959.1 hypothetical protein AUTU_14420 [Aureibacter tunicatorum]
MTKDNLHIDFTVYSPRFQEWTGTDWILEKFKDKIYKTDEYNHELSIKDFDDNLISIIVDDYIVELDKSDNENERISFDGGFQLTLGKIRIDYNCCGEFYNYKNWIKILTERKSSWAEIWIGHPWIYYKIEGGYIVLSNYTEDLNKVEELVRFDFKQFEILLKEWLNEIAIFKGKIKEYIVRKYHDKADYYYGQMIDGE